LPPGIRAEIKNAVASAIKESDGMVWKLALVALPVVLTALLGFWVTQETKAVEQRIAQSNARLEARLSLTEEFYKRRLDAYQKVYATLLALQAAVTEAQFSNQQAAINDALGKIHAYRTDQALYLSSTLRSRLGQLWESVATAAINDPVVVSTVSKAMADIDAIARSDLQVDQIGKIDVTGER
jgi:hypothetical protein